MLTDKKLEKIAKILGESIVEEIGKMDAQILKNTIATAEGSIKYTQDQLEANPKYIDLKESLKALSEGLRDVKKRQRAIITLCVSMLEDKA